jgi:CHASE2 domain-containing sensor protein
MLAARAAWLILVALGVVHLYWAAGGAFGKEAAIPMKDGRPLFHPTPIGTALVAFVLFAMAALIAVKIGWIPAPAFARPVHAGLWLLAILFLLRAIGDFRYVGFFKRARHSRFAMLDTVAYSPLCMLLAGLLAISASS